MRTLPNHEVIRGRQDGRHYCSGDSGRRVSCLVVPHEIAQGAATNAADPLQPVQAADPTEAEIGEVYCGQTRRELSDGGMHV
jgi:hypothetical protein